MQNPDSEIILSVVKNYQDLQGERAKASEIHDNGIKVLDEVKIIGDIVQVSKEAQPPRVVFLTTNDTHAHFWMQRAIVKCIVQKVAYAATGSFGVDSIPSVKCLPSMTFSRCLNPRRRRQIFPGHCPNLNIMCNIPSRVRQPLVRLVRCRMVSKVDSSGFVVRTCCQCGRGTHRTSATPLNLSLNLRWPSDTWPHRF